MIFIEAIGSAYSKYFQTSGRSSRSEWWFFVFFLFIVGKCLNLLSYSSFCDSNNCEVPIFLFSVIFVLATVIPFCALCIRRLHDIGLSGWWMNIAFTVIGIIPFFYWMCKKGDEDENQYGLDPLAPFRNGKRHGLWTEWYPNGKKKLETRYKNGVENGLRTEWAEDGKKTFQATFKDGNEQ